MKIEPLNLKVDPDPDLAAAERKPFWRRQFQLQPTEQQTTFDWTFGVVLPLVCFYFDFLVFKGAALLGQYRPFAFLLSSVSIMAMIAWLLWGRRLGGLTAALAGLFIAGSFVSFMVGIFLLPFSLIGMFVLIGFLGFTPLLTGLVFLRNGVRALNVANDSLEPRVVLQAAVLAAMFGLIIPYVVNVQISNLIDDVIRTDYQTMQRSATKLEMVRPLVSFEPLKKSYYETSPDRMTPRVRMLAEIYERNTGERILFEPAPRFLGEYEYTYESTN